MNRRFQAKLVKSKNMHIIKTTASIPTKFCTAIKTAKYPSWVVQTRAWQIQDGGRPPSWTSRKIAISQERLDRSPWNLTWGRSSSLLSVRPLKFRKLKNSRWPVTRRPVKTTPKWQFWAKSRHPLKGTFSKFFDYGSIEDADWPFAQILCRSVSLQINASSKNTTFVLPIFRQNFNTWDSSSAYTYAGKILSGSARAVSHWRERLLRIIRANLLGLVLACVFTLTRRRMLAAVSASVQRRSRCKWKFARINALVHVKFGCWSAKMYFYII